MRFFGGLAYLVTLSDRYEGADFFNTLIYDAQRGEINTVLVVHEQAEFLQVEEIRGSNKTVWSDRVKSGEWFVNFLDREISRGQMPEGGAVSDGS